MTPQDAKKILTKEIERKLKGFAYNLFDDMQYDKDYPFHTWEEQFEELKEAFANGEISEDFLDFVSGERKIDI
jgi:hypothetical protein